jgi:flap endonuclease-1
MLAELGITREGLVDLAILVGTDFNPGIKGIGPKKALALVKRHGAIEHMPAEIRDALMPIAPAIRELYLTPDITDHYSVEPAPCDVQGVVRFLCEEREFSEQRVIAALERAFPSQFPGGARLFE